jgi:hypothetical protein
MFTKLVWAWIVIGIFTFIILLVTKVRTPYGRHTRTGWGPLIANKWGWFFMELPALFIMPVLSIIGPNGTSKLNWLLAGLWFLHYAHRTLIFPFRLHTVGKKMPLSIVLSAIFFNGVNGALNGYYLGFMADANQALVEPYLIIGLVLFIIGMLINLRSDYHLIGLRKSNTGYQIPKGGLFNFISCPNHFGEIVEWTGFAVIAWNLPALSFALWTCFNLIPRALNHHAWYKEHFTDYPPKRKAVLPQIL